MDFHGTSHYYVSNEAIKILNKKIAKLLFVILEMVLLFVLLEMENLLALQWV